MIKRYRQFYIKSHKAQQTAPFVEIKWKTSWKVNFAKNTSEYNVVAFVFFFRKMEN